MNKKHENGNDNIDRSEKKAYTVRNEEDFLPLEWRYIE